MLQQAAVVTAAVVVVLLLYLLCEKLFFDVACSVVESDVLFCTLSVGGCRLIRARCWWCVYEFYVAAGPMLFVWIAITECSAASSSTASTAAAAAVCVLTRFQCAHL